MANYHDPTVIAQHFFDLSTGTVAKFWHVVDGLYIWEFFTTLDYEASVIQGRRPYRWTIWLYSLTRVATLMAVVMSMIGFDVTTPINCQLWIISELTFSYTAIAAASMLIVIRVIAIWNRNRVVSVIAICTWATNIAALIRSIVLLRSVSSHVNDTGTCYLSNTLASKLNLMTSLAADIVLLLIMLVGLLRWRLQEGGMPNIARFLWTQGLIWLLIATFSYVPTVADADRTRFGSNYQLHSTSCFRFLLLSLCQLQQQECIAPSRTSVLVTCFSQLPNKVGSFYQRPIGSVSRPSRRRRTDWRWPCGLTANNMRRHRRAVIPCMSSRTTSCTRNLMDGAPKMMQRAGLINEEHNGNRLTSSTSSCCRCHERYVSSDWFMVDESNVVVNQRPTMERTEPANDIRWIHLSYLTLDKMYTCIQSLCQVFVPFLSLSAGIRYPYRNSST
ncbi:hypothetical protein F5148DRAFT_1372202 [Russula earlei]|uniref:Uncharacterized protein n=1 Tax=Russula earlei TaxID=71964 RepID=A0ACC0TQR7_9AGAM|nr:hypothetical protein F5148DRAFT_1372202 [Russula earlei]